MTASRTSPNLLSSEAVADPYTFFGAMREEEPVHWNEDQRAWVLTRYEDVAAAYTDRRLSSDRVQAVYDQKLSAEERQTRAPTFGLLANWMVFKDPPDHTRLRNLVKLSFAPRAIARLEPRVVSVIEHVLDSAPSGELDLIGDIAYPIPALVIAEMLGVPGEERARFRAWSNELSGVIFQGRRGAEERQRSQDGLIALSDFLHDLVQHYRRRPGDNLISQLIESRDAGAALSEEEIVSTCVLLLFAGHETTTNLIANGFLALLREPEQARLLVERPSVIAAAVEELNRYDGPAKMSVRRAAAPLEVRGRLIEAGSKVLLVQAAANRDPRRFGQPDRIQLDRADNRNIAFGFGIHYCLGAPLARLEVSQLLPRLLQRLREPQFDPAALTYQPLLLTRGLESFPIRYG